MNEQQACALCQNMIDVDQLVISEHGQICPICEVDQATPLNSGPPTVVFIAGGMALAPFMFGYQVVKSGGLSLTHFRVGPSFSVLSRHPDYFALIAGVATLVLGLLGAWRCKQNGSAKWMAVCIALSVLGLIHAVVRSGFLIKA